MASEIFYNTRQYGRAIARVFFSTRSFREQLITSQYSPFPLPLRHSYILSTMIIIIIKEAGLSAANKLNKCEVSFSVERAQKAAAGLN